MSKNIKTKIILFLFISGLITGFVLGGITGYIFQENKENNVSINNNSSINTPPETNPLPGEDLAEKEIKKYHFTGQIMNIAENQIIIKVDQEKNIIININENTQFKQFNLDSNESSDIKLSDLKKNDYITALSSENINNETEITARQINLYIEE